MKINFKENSPLQETEGTETFLFFVSLPNLERDWPLMIQAGYDEILHLVGFPWITLLIQRGAHDLDQ